LWGSKRIERPTDAELFPTTVNNNKAKKSYNPVNFLYFSRSVNTFFATKYKEKNAACQDFSHQIVNTLQKKQEEKGIFLTRASILQYDCQHFGSFG
jgi:hypothetical protein